VKDALALAAMFETIYSLTSIADYIKAYPESRLAKLLRKGA
jgi:hypothetical protein